MFLFLVAIAAAEDTDGTAPPETPVPPSGDGSAVLEEEPAPEAEEPPSEEGEPPSEEDISSFTIEISDDSSEAAAVLEERKEAASVSEIIGAEQMAKAGDSDAAAALRRVTGLTVVGGKYVYVRGLGDRYSATLLNGSSLPSPEPERRVVPLDLFPTTLLDSVVIQKTPSPDRPGEFGGGVVEVRAKGIPESNFLTVGINGGYSAGTTFTQGITGARGPTDWLGFGQGYRAMPEEISSTSDEPLKAGGMFSDAGYTAEELETFGELFENRWAVDQRSLPPDFGMSASAGAWAPLGAADIGGRIGLVFNNAWDLEGGVRRIYSDGGSGLELKRETTFTETANTIRLGGAATWGVTWADTAELVSTTLWTRNSEATAIQWDANDPTGSEDTRSTRLGWTEQQLVYEQVALTGEIGPVETDLRYGLAVASGAEPDRREYVYSLTEDGYFVSQRAGWNEILYTSLKDVTQDFAADVDWSLQIPGGKAVFSLGVGQVTRARASSTRRFSYGLRGSDGLDLAAPMEDILVPENIGKADDADTGFLEIEESTTNSDDYTAGQSLRTAYLQADVPWSVRVKTLVGARIEDSTQTVSTYELFDAERAPVQAELSSLDVLPTAGVTFAIAPAPTPDTMLIRLVYGRTLSRPEFRELSEVPFYDYRSGRLLFGNPDLERAVIDNVDLRWEWYPTSEEAVSVAGFFKHFDSPIESIVAVSAVSGSVGTFENATAATNLGVEADVRKGLGFIGRALMDFSIAGNVAFIYSRVDLSDSGGNQTSSVRPLQGQSPYVANIQLGYENERSRTSGTILYNVFGPRIVEVGTSGIPDTFELPVHRVDLVLSQGFARDWSVKLKGSNLLDSRSRERTGEEIAEEVRNGWGVGLGVTWSPV